MSELIERLAHHGEDPKIARLSRVPLFNDTFWILLEHEVCTHERS